MRWVFLTLVILNLLVFALMWKKQMDAPVEKEEVIELLEGKNIKLISELNPAKIEKIDVAAREGAQRCYSIGPFGDRIDAKHMKARAQALGFSPELKQLLAHVEHEYWVYLKPQSSRQEALRLLKELLARKIDSYVITSGELAEGISLGLFRNKDLADELSDRMAKLEYDVAIKPVSRGAKELWMEFRQVSQLTELMRNKISADNDKVQWMLADCIDEEVAEKPDMIKK